MSTSPDRVANDFYETPPAVTHSLLDMVPQIHGTILEPCVGDHAIADVLRIRGRVQIITNDIDTQRRADWHLDAANIGMWQSQQGQFDWIVSNPPFSAANWVVPYAVSVASVGVAVLLRISFMEPVENRRAFLLANPPQHQLTTQRISFRTSARKSKTDTVTTAWFIWTRDRQPLAGVPPHGVLIWKNRGSLETLQVPRQVA